MKKRSLLTVLAALLLASCAADDPTQAAVSTAPVTEHTQLQTEASDGGRSQMQDGLPADLDFDGRSFGIYVYEEAAKYTIGLEDAAGDIVNDAVIARNIAVEERLNITLSQFSQPNGSINTVSSLLMAGDPAYDLFIAYQYEMAPLISRGGLYNLYHLDNIDFSQPWWWENYMQQLQLGGDILMALDLCTHPDDPPEAQRRSVELTVAWAARCRAARISCSPAMLIMWRRARWLSRTWRNWKPWNSRTRKSW